MKKEPAAISIHGPAAKSLRRTDFVDTTKAIMTNMTHQEMLSAKICVIATPIHALAGKSGAINAERNKTILGLERFVAKPVRKVCRSRPNWAPCSASDIGTALRESHPALKVEYPM